MHANCSDMKTEEELILIQCMEFIEQMYKTDEVLEFVCLMWSASEEDDYYNINEREDEVLEVGE